MKSVLAYIDLTIVGYIATFVATLVFSQKIKDFLSGVPPEFRTAMSSVEQKAKADVKAATAEVFAKLHPPAAPAPAPAPAAPAAPVAPPAPAPGA